MKKNLKSLIAVFLVISVFVGAVPLYKISTRALTSGQYTYTVSGGIAKITGYEGRYDSSGEPIMVETLTIPSTLGGYPVTTIGERAFQWCEVIRGLVLSDNITTLEDYAFYWCENLTNVTIGSGITDIPAGTFLYCENLQTVSFGSNVETIGADAFSNCTLLDNVVMPASLKSIGSYAFNKCTALSNITLNDGLESIANNAFYSCSSLSNIVIPDSVTFIGNKAFSKTNNIIIHCHQNTYAYQYAEENSLSITIIVAITGIAVTTYPQKTVYAMGESFDSTGMVVTASYDNNTFAAVEDYTVEGFSSAAPGPVTVTLSHRGMTATLTVTIVEYTYTIVDGTSATLTRYVGNETQVTVPDTIGGYPVTSIGERTFENLTAITGITILSTVTSVGAYAFAGCTSLTSITVPASVTVLDTNTFAGSSLQSINVAPANTSYASADGILTSKDGTELLCYPSGRTDTSYTIPSAITGISSYAFNNCDALHDLYIYNTCSVFGDNAIYGCDNIDINCYQYSAAHTYAASSSLPYTFIATVSGIDITTLPTKLMYLIGDELDLRGMVLTVTYTDSTSWATSDYTSEGFASNRVGTKEITIIYAGYSDTFTITISEPEDTVFSYTLIDDGTHAEITAYTGSGGSITIPSRIDNYPVTSIGTAAFSGNNTIIGAALPSSLVNIGESAFRLCMNLERIEITSNVISIGREAFYGCSGMTSIDLGTSIQSIGEYAFYNCSGLTSISIPDSVHSIGIYAFYNCSLLQTVEIGAGTASIGNFAFLNCNALTQIITDTANSSFSSINGVLYSKNQNVLLCYPSGKTGTEFTLPTSVRTISIGAFCNTQLNKLYIPRSVTAINPEAFSGNTLTIYCYENTAAHTFAAAGEIAYVLLEAQAPVSISILTLPSKLTYTVGESLDLTCLSVAAVYPDTTMEVITNYTVTGFSSATAGTVVITVHYENCTAQFTVTVSEPLEIPDFEYTMAEDNVHAIITGYLGSGGAVTIPDVIDGHPVISIGASAFERCATIESIVISNGIESIAASAFAYCPNLTDITFPTSINIIGNDAFYQCAMLQSVSFSEGLEEIGTYAFSQCSSIKYIVLPESLSALGVSAFNGCVSLESITIPSGIDEIASYAFANCSMLTSVLSGVTVTSIGYAAFSNCSSITVYCYEDSATHTYCESTPVNYKLIDSNSEYTFVIENNTVTIIRYNGNGGTVTIPETINSLPVTAIGGHAFLGCQTITTITVPSSVTSIGAGAFAMCPALGKITIPAEVTSFSNIYVFEGSPNVTVYCMEFSAAHNLARNNSISFILLDNVTLLSIVITSPPQKTVYAINEALDLTGLVITANYSNATSTVLESGSYHVSGFDSSVEGAKTIIFTFDGKTASVVVSVLLPEYYYTVNQDETITITAYNGTLPNPTIPQAFDGYTVSAIGDSAFERNTIVTSVSMASSIKTIGSRAFYSCPNLSSITIGSGVTSIASYAFYGCTNLTSISFPDNVQTLEGYVLHDCTALSSVRIGSGLSSIGFSAFRGCTGLMQFVVDEDNAYFAVHDNALYLANYSTLICYPSNASSNSHTIPNVTTAIDSYAFNSCALLINITIPKSVTSIAATVVANCLNGLTFRCYRNSAAHDYATRNNITVVLLDTNQLTVIEGLSTISVNHTSGYSTGFNLSAMTVSQILECYSEVDVSMLNADGVPITGSAPVGTGCQVVLKNNGTILETSTVLVYGDIDGDGYVDGNDAFFTNMITDGVLLTSSLAEPNALAADANRDGLVDDLDAQLLMDCGIFAASVSQV